MPEPDLDEQLRRLKNTIMGAGHRLNLLAGSAEVGDDYGQELAAVGRELGQLAQQLERLLLQRRR